MSYFMDLRVGKNSWFSVCGLFDNAKHILDMLIGNFFLQKKGNLAALGFDSCSGSSLEAHLVYYVLNKSSTICFYKC